ncbi:AAA family ATPase [Nonomuraea dietziae]|uniref:cytidylate kinase-like family protein n=1 Tax=Nonomuraea dietziae TaxID=65515 RepID=UPI0031E2ADD4
MPFVDRAIPSAVAEELGCSIEEALVHDDRAEHGLGRLLSGAMRLPTVTFGGVDMYLPGAMPLPPEEFVTRTERMIKETARASGWGLPRPRGGARAGRAPWGLHVRLDAPARRRILQTAALSEVSERAARKLVEDNDRARSAYVRHFYRADPADPRLYQLVVDSTTSRCRACVELIVIAAEAVN